MTGPAFSDTVAPAPARGRREKSYCGADKRQGEGTCTRPAGWGTPHVGTGACKLHGGSTPNAVKAAAKAEARHLLGTLGVVDDPAALPIPVVHAELQLSAAKQLAAVRWLELRVGDLRPEQVEVSPWPAMLRDARRDSDKLLVDLARLGLDAQRVQLDERRLDVMVLVLQRVLSGVQERVQARLGHALPELAGETVGPLVHQALTEVGGEVG